MINRKTTLKSEYLLKTSVRIMVNAGSFAFAILPKRSPVAK